MWWVVARFDTLTLPARHGQVDAVLYARDGEQRPLLVGLGGGEGGNAWASDRWKPQRERFLEQGYALLKELGMPFQIREAKPAKAKAAN